MQDENLKGEYEALIQCLPGGSIRAFYIKSLSVLSIIVLISALYSSAPCQTMQSRKEDSSRSGENPGGSGFILLRGGNLDPRGRGDLSAKAVFGHKFTPVVSLGMGVSRETWDDYKFSSGYAHVRVTMIEGRISPYFYVDAGYTALPPVPGAPKGELFLAASGGVEAFLTSNLGIMAGLDIRRTYSDFENLFSGFYGGLDFTFKKNEWSVVKPGLSGSSETGKIKVKTRAGAASLEGDLGFSAGLMSSMEIMPLTEVGLGLGWEEFEYNSFISLCVSGKRLYNSNRISPFLACETGYAIERADGVSTSRTNGPLMGIGAGVNFSIDDKIAIFGQVDYKSQWSRRYLVSYYNNVRTTYVRFDIFRFNTGVSFW